ncbi:MAG: OmpH family outer membrane protein [Opitutus sp.]|nr:OmpH family outer membrane protein [Opitutus sp.]
MNKPIPFVIALAAFVIAAVTAQAQVVKIHVVDMAKLYDSHYKTVEQNGKIQADDQKAQEEVDKMNKEGNGLVEEYKALADQSTNPALSAEAKSKAQNEAQKKMEGIQQKKTEIATFIQNTRNSLQQRLQSFRSLMLEEISKLAADVAKRKGATLLLDKAGPTGIGISNLVYSDPGFDITDEVMKEINKAPPAASTAAPAAASAAPAAAPASASPGITVPGVAPKK